MTLFQVLIEKNDFDARGLIAFDAPWVDSFIDLKGERSIVQYNTFHENGGRVSHGVALWKRGDIVTGRDHVVRDNTFTMDTDNGDAPAIVAHGGNENVVVWNNGRNPSGIISDGPLTTLTSSHDMPNWYNAFMKKVHTIYSNRMLYEFYWSHEVSRGSVSLNYDDGGSHASTYRANLGRKGKITFVAQAADLTGYNEIRFYDRAITKSGAKLRIQIYGGDTSVRTVITPKSEWEANVFDFTMWFPGEDVYAVEISNMSKKPVSVLFDDIRFTN